MDAQQTNQALPTSTPTPTLPGPQSFWKWLLSVYSEPDGNGSSTRIHMTALISFVIGIGLAFGIATHNKKFTIEEFNSFLGAGGAFIVTTCGPLYGMNKLSSWGKDKNANQPGA